MGDGRSEVARGAYGGGVLNAGERHLPCVVLVDTSTSMKDCIDDLNVALEQFREELISDDETCSKVEVCLITFNDHARVVTSSGFVPVPFLEWPRLEAGGLTSMYEAVDLAIKKIEERKAVYNANHIRSYEPYVFLLTDGRPTDADQRPVAHAFMELRQRQQRERPWRFVPLALGTHADKDFLRQQNVEGTVYAAGKQNLAELFRFVSATVISVPNNGQTPPAPSDVVDVITQDDDELFATVPVPAPAPLPSGATDAQPSSGMRCPTCNKVYPAGDRFCHDDGTLLVPARGGEYTRPVVDLARRCPVCRKAIRDDDLFCQSCGARLQTSRSIPTI